MAFSKNLDKMSLRNVAHFSFKEGSRIFKQRAMSEANEQGSNANCFALREDLKTAAMREFPLKAGGERREERTARNFRQEIYL